MPDLVVSRAHDGQRGWVLPAILAELLLAGLCLVLYLTVDTRWGFAVTGILCMALSHVPFVRKRQGLLSMWGLASFAITVGAGIRGVMIATGWPDSYLVEQIFLLGSSFDDLVGAGLVAVGTVAGLVVGYLAVDPTGAPERAASSRWALRPTDLSEGAALLIASVYAAVGLLGTVVYTRSVGGLEAATSDRRTVIPGQTTTSTFTSYGEYEFLAQAGSIGAVFLLTYWLGRHRRLGIVRKLALGVLFLNGFAINVVTTTRADLVYVAAAAAIVVVIVRGRLHVPLLVAGALAVLLAIGALSAARTQTADPSERGGIVYAVDSALLNRNAYDLSKTLRIIEAVPERLPLQYGQTIASYVIAPVPRAVWPDKPVISPGPIIGRELYYTERSGVPPGMSGELVWNFGVPGALLLSVLLGLVLGRLERRFYPSDPDDLCAIVFYASVVLILGQSVLGVSIGQAASISLQTAVMLVPLWLLGRRARGQPDRSSARPAALSRDAV